jgi:hypothetical protein
MSNPFEAFATESRSPKQRASDERKLVMTAKQAEKQFAPRAQEKAQIEKHRLAADYRRWKAELLRGLLAGPHGREIVGLRKFIRRLGIGDAAALVAHVGTLTWLWDITPERRFQVRAMIAYGIRRLRQRNGFHPFDDAMEMFGEDMDASTTILRMLA